MSPQRPSQSHYTSLSCLSFLRLPVLKATQKGVSLCVSVARGGGRVPAPVDESPAATTGVRAGRDRSIGAFVGSSYPVSFRYVLKCKQHMAVFWPVCGRRGDIFRVELAIQRSLLKHSEASSLGDYTASPGFGEACWKHDEGMNPLWLCLTGTFWRPKRSQTRFVVCLVIPGFMHAE